MLVDGSQGAVGQSGGVPEREVAMQRQWAELSVRSLSADSWPMLEDLFGPAGASNGCWCMYPRLGSEYKRRSREENKCDLRRLAQATPSPGLLVMASGIALGWCQVAPRIDLSWLTTRRMFQTDDQQDVWAIACFYVRRSHRRQGLTSLLIDAAVEAAAMAGASAVEAYPVDTGVPGHTKNLFPGVVSTFDRHGFEVVSRQKKDRPIMRRALRDE